MNLPHHELKTWWATPETLPTDWGEKGQEELERATKASGWSPKLIKLSEEIVCIDVCGSTGSTTLHSMNLCRYVDHPFLLTLPSNAPRAVKSLYKKEVGLKHIRCGCLFTIMEDVRAAEEAWTKYLKETKDE